MNAEPSKLVKVGLVTSHDATLSFNGDPINILNSQEMSVQAVFTGVFTADPIIKLEVSNDGGITWSEHFSTATGGITLTGATSPTGVDGFETDQVAWQQMRIVYDPNGNTVGTIELYIHMKTD